MTSRDRGLEGVRAVRTIQLLCPVQCCEATADEQLIPASTILIEQQDRLSRGAEPRPSARFLDLHQRHQTMDLRLRRRQLGQDPAQTKRLLRELRSHPVIAGGCRVALVEYE